MDAQTIGIIAAAVTILGGIFAALKWGRSAFKKLWHFITRFKPRVPRETIRIVPQSSHCRWSEASVSGRPAMQLSGEWHVTNIIVEPVRVLSSRIKRPRTEGMTITRHPEQDIYGRYPILPHQTSEVHSHFMLVPSVRRVGENYKATVILTDQFGNDHKIRNVVFRGPAPKVDEAKHLEQELVHRIQDPIEKDVAAVLKAELARYKSCGRRVGGLGSIETTIEGHRYAGIGTEWRKADSPENQAIVLGQNELSVTSDNAEALIALYSGLPSDEERQRFVDALLNRMSKDKEYAPVGYFILFVLFRVGKLNEALGKAKSDLMGDGEYGFSDFLRLLDGLLRIQHAAFSLEMLDTVEQFIDGLSEHTFGISERLVSIRAYRLGKGSK